MGRKNRSRDAARQATAADSAVATVRKSAATPAPSAPLVKTQTLLWKRNLIVAAGLGALMLLVYSNSFRAGFPLDNAWLIKTDPRVHAATRVNVGLIWNDTYWWPESASNLYRPLTTLSYLFNYAVLGNGTNPTGYHVINFLLHWLNTFLVYLLALRLLRREWPAIFAAALWAAHPLLTESVTNIIGRADLLACLAILGGLLMYLRSTESTGWRRFAWLAGVAALTAIGIFSKESAVAVMGVIVLYELTWWKEKKNLRALLYGCAAAGLPILLMLAKRWAVLAASGPDVPFYLDNPISGASFLAGRLTAISVIGKYLWLLVWPLKLSADYSYNQIPIVTGTMREWISCGAALLVVIGTVALYKKSRVAFFFAGFAVITFVPVANILFPIGTIMAERLVYAPSIGFAGCMVMLFYWLAARIGQPAFAPAVLCVIIVAFAVRTWERNFAWRDDVSLWRASLAAAPNSYKTHGAYAYALDAADPNHPYLEEQISEAEKSLAILSSLPDAMSTSDAYSDMGRFLEEKGDTLRRIGPDGRVVSTPESTAEYKKSLEMLLHGVAIDRIYSAEREQAELKSGKPRSEIAPSGQLELYDRLAWTYLRLGDSADAYKASLHAQVLSPNRTDTYVVMAEALATSNQQEDAAVALLEGLLYSGDRKLVPMLQEVYRRGIDPTGCAFVQTANGPFLNNNCAPVHRDICKAYVELREVSLRAGVKSLADSAAAKATQLFGCPADEPK